MCRLYYYPGLRKQRVLLFVHSDTTNQGAYHCCCFTMSSWDSLHQKAKTLEARLEVCDRE
jgi:hypothetical protein